MEQDKRFSVTYGPQQGGTVTAHCGVHHLCKTGYARPKAAADRLYERLHKLSDDEILPAIQKWHGAA